MKPALTQSRVTRNRPAIALCLVALVLIFVGAVSQAHASYVTQPPLLQANQTPTAASGGADAPLPQATSLTATAGAVATGQPQPVPTGGGAAGGTTAGGTTAAGGSSGGGFPWLIVIGVLLIALAGLGYAFMRPRGQAVTATASRAPAPEAARTTTTTTTQAATAAPVVAPAPAPPVPATIKCPNCGTVNTTEENFCHECGQDLRPLIAQVTQVSAAGAGAGAPVDVVEDDTPYLETLDRADEQLEYVLSRPKVAIGTAPGNDIIIDSSFKGAQTVSPRHAELHREQDGFVIVDRDSQYGTFVNEMRTGENILSDGDLIRLGDVRFIFRVPQAGQ